MRDLIKSVTELCKIPTVLTTADLVGAGVDLLGVKGVRLDALIGADTGTLLDGSNYIDIHIEESVDNSTWTDVAAADVLGASITVASGLVHKIDDAAEAEQIYSVRYIGSKPFVRISAEVTGTINCAVALSAEKDLLTYVPEV